MKRMLQFLTIAGAVAGAVWYSRQQDEATTASAEGEWSPRPALTAVPDPVPAAPSADEPSDPADDLTDIKGIGPKYSQQLTEIGITTFAALAKSDPATLAAEFDARATTEDWIAQAKERAKG